MGKSVKLLHLDLETTGLYSRKHGIIQISGAIEVDNKIEEEFDWKANIFEQDEVSEKALEVNNTTREQISQYQDPREVYKELVHMLCQYVDAYSPADKFHIVGYKVDFDTGFFREFFKKNGDKFYGSYFFPNSIDVMDLCSHYLLSERHLMKNFKLGTVYSHVFKKEIPKDLHDATADIKYTMELYKHVTRR